MTPFSVFLYAVSLTVGAVAYRIWRARRWVDILRAGWEEFDKPSYSDVTSTELPKDASKYFRTRAEELGVLGFSPLLFYRDTAQGRIGKAFQYVTTSFDNRVLGQISYALSPRYLGLVPIALPWVRITGHIVRGAVFESVLTDGTRLVTHNLPIDFGSLPANFKQLHITNCETLRDLFDEHLRWKAKECRERQIDAVQIESIEQYFEFDQQARRSIRAHAERELERGIEEIREANSASWL